MNYGRRKEGGAAERGALWRAPREFLWVKEERAFSLARRRVWGTPQNSQAVSENRQEQREAVENPSTNPL